MKKDIKHIPGRLIARVVGIVELFMALFIMCVYIYAVVKYDGVPHAQTRTVLFGIYFTITLLASSLLIFATFKVIGLKNRRIIAIAWCIFRTVILITAFITLVSSDVFAKGLWLIFVSMIVWLICIVGVAVFAYGLSKAMEWEKVEIEKMKMRERRKSIATGNNRSRKNKNAPSPIQLPEISA